MFHAPWRGWGNQQALQTGTSATPGQVAIASGPDELRAVQLEALDGVLRTGRRAVASVL